MLHVVCRTIISGCQEHCANSYTGDMNRPRLARALRITWTAFWGLAAILLVALWVRSYWIVDLVNGNLTPHVAGFADLSRGQLDLWQMSASNALQVGDWAHDTASAEEFYRDPTSVPYLTSDGNLIVPLWLPVILTATLAAAPWIRWSKRFSLRTLLIAMSLVAVVLGTIVLLSR
jgi:hypothetical protein